MSKMLGVFIPRMGNYKNALLSDSYGIRNKFRFSFLKGPWDKKLRPKINDENKQQTPKNRMLGNDYRMTSRIVQQSSDTVSLGF